MRHMNPYLMGAPGFEAHFCKRKAAQLLQGLVVCNGVPAALLHHRHFLSVRFVAGNRGVNGSVFRQSAENDGIVHS